MNDAVINTTSVKIGLKDIKNICNITFKRLNVINPVFNIVIINNEEIKKINKNYRGIDCETDVLSFAFEETDDNKISDVRVLGEVYISIDKAVEQASEYGHSLKREICFLTVHGLLHLLGYDHIDEKDRELMRKLEEEILDEYDIKR